MKRIAREHGVEPLALRVPRLEVGADDVDAIAELRQPPRGERGEICADLHRLHPQAALEERPSRLSRPGANLEDTVTDPKLGEADELVEDLPWRDRPTGVVGSSVLVEGQPVLLTPRLRGESRRKFGVRHDPILTLAITRRGED